jgi:hypothetical protein
MTQLAGGQFMARRVQKEAWPLMQQLLEKGVAAGCGSRGSLAAAAAAGGWGEGEVQGPGSRKGGVQGQGHVSSALLQLEMGLGQKDRSLGSGGSGEREVARRGESGEMAPAAVARVQAGVMGCLEGIAGYEGSAAALQGMVWGVGAAVVRFLEDEAGAVARGASLRLLGALGEVDGDAIWLLLLDAAQSGGGVEPPVNPVAGDWPSFRQLLGAGVGGGKRDDSQLGGKGGKQRSETRLVLGRGGARRAAALWRALDVRHESCRWHAKVSEYLDAWKQEGSL